jgi:N-acetyl-beta-hexosaminidase
LSPEQARHIHRRPGERLVPALAEVAWSPKEARDWPSFLARARGKKMLDEQRVRYRMP